MNNFKTVALLGFMSALVALVAQTMSGSFWVAMIFVVGFNFVAYFFSDRMALASSGARPVAEHELPQVYSIVSNLTARAGMPMPSIHLIDSPQPNAFATGRNPKHAAVAVTTGILQTLNNDELEGVLGHELSHVANRDILISSIAAMMAAALSMFARMAFWFGRGNSRDNPLGPIIGILSLILAPFAAMLIRYAISRTREFHADESGAELTGRPLALASALEKISVGATRVPMPVNPATAQLYIENPLKGLRGQGVSRLLSTHPPTEERIARLTDMAQGIKRR
jgi:heat shock protein HtpX